MWDGIERRNTTFCVEHKEMSRKIDTIFVNSEVAKEKTINLDRRINGALDAVEKHMESGSKWRMGIVSIAAALLMTIFGITYGYGRLTKTVENNTEMIRQSLKLGIEQRATIIKELRDETDKKM